MLRRLRSTPVRTFALYPLACWALEAAVRRGRPPLDARGVPLLAWGYLQYRWCGRYRRHHGKGGPGPEVPPERLVTTGPYAYTRNPMYLGHLIFLAGLAIALHSPRVGIFAIGVAAWFHRRVLRDEAGLAARFGSEYADYRRRARRWLPGLL